MGNLNSNPLSNSVRILRWIRSSTISQNFGERRDSFYSDGRVKLYFCMTGEAIFFCQSAFTRSMVDYT